MFSLVNVFVDLRQFMGEGEGEGEEAIPEEDRFANKGGFRSPLMIPCDQDHSPWTLLILLLI
ncbi:hypothetical protein CCP2SC5_1030004 [Azospirillaceae bacterium]